MNNKLWHKLPSSPHCAKIEQMWANPDSVNVSKSGFGIESTYTPVTSRGHFLLELAVFAVILPSAVEDFITASFQTDKTMKWIKQKMNKKTMNETENRQRKVNQQIKRRIPGKRIQRIPSNPQVTSSIHGFKFPSCEFKLTSYKINFIR